MAGGRSSPGVPQGAERRSVATDNRQDRTAELEAALAALQARVQELEDALRRERAIDDALPDVVTVAHRDGRLVDVRGNHELQARLQIRAGQDIREIFPGEIATERLALTARALETGSPQVHEFTVQDGGGTSHWETRITPLDADHVIMTARDVTGSREAARRLRLAMNALESSITAVAIIAPDGRVTYVNEAMLELWGFAAAGDVVGRRAVDLFDSVDETEAAIEALRDRGVWRGDLRARRADGDVRLVRLSAALLRSEHGDVAGVVATFIDVTEWHAAQEERLRAADQLRVVAASAPIIVFACDADGTVTFSEGQGLLRLGRRPGQYVGRNAFEAFASQPDIIEPLRRALRGEDVSGLVRFEGTIWETRFAPRRDPEGRVVGAITVSLDVTERQQADEAVAKTQRLEDLGLLAGGVAHDFNNYLAAILGNAQIALAEPGLAAGVRESLEFIQRSAMGAGELTRQLLAYAGRAETRVQRVDLGRLVRDTHDLLRPSLAREIEIVYDLDEATPAVTADPTQLRQVLMNLVINAAEAIGAGPGTITVSTTPVEVKGELPELRAGRYAVLRVHDTGPGMDDRTRERVFEPFFSTKFTGRGLGLAAVQGIVRAHNGAIAVESRPGEGTTFHVYLPAAEGDA